MNGQTSWGERMLAVFVALVILFSAFPLLIIFPVSLNSAAVLAMPTKGLSLQWYLKVFTESRFPQAFTTSIAIAAIATLAALAIGSLAAWVFTRRPFKGRGIVEAFFLSPLILARVVYGVSMLIVLNQFGLSGSIVGLAIAHTVIVLPYVVRVVGSSLLGTRRALEEAANILGANHAQTLWYVTLPLIRPGLAAAGVFSFITSMDEFTLTVFLVSPGVTTLPVQIFREVELIVDPTVAAVSALLILITAVLVLLVERTMGLEKILRA